MSLYENILNREEKVSVIGLGYVGMPLAISFSKMVDTIGFDINEEKIELYNKGIDITDEVGSEELKNTKVIFTSDESILKEAKFHIVAVPTPINNDKKPNLQHIKEASEIVGRNLINGSIVVYESTVYPGVTEDICVPILEKESGLKCGVDFKVGYSPERINPGDKIHRLETITKVVAGMDEDSLEEISRIYEIIIEAGVYRAESIKVAEAAKVIENSQRDINIAFVNELSIIFNKIGIDTKSVLETAKTKWNFLDFTPGLVGGHCIGVDPYYLTYEAEQVGYHPEVILSGRKINDNMGKYIAECTVKNLIKVDKQIKSANILLMGITFKEDCPDVRNSKVIDIIRELEEYGINVIVTDPIADSNEVKQKYGIRLSSMSDVENIDGIVIAVGHKEYKSMSLDELRCLYSLPQLVNYNGDANCVAITVDHDLEDKLVLMDIKGIFNNQEAESQGYLYWRL